MRQTKRNGECTSWAWKLLPVNIRLDVVELFFYNLGNSDVTIKPHPYDLPRANKCNARARPIQRNIKAKPHAVKGQWNVKQKKAVVWRAVNRGCFLWSNYNPEEKTAHTVSLSAAVTELNLSIGWHLSVVHSYSCADSRLVTQHQQPKYDEQIQTYQFIEVLLPEGRIVSPNAIKNNVWTMKSIRLQFLT